MARGSGFCFCASGRAASLVHLAGGEAGLVQKQVHLAVGELLTFGTEQTQVEQTDVFVLELEEAGQPGDLRLEVGGPLSGIGSGC